MDYQGNSNRSKEPENEEKPVKVVERVVVGEVITRKKPVGRKIKEIFFGGELRGAAQYIAADVLLPALRNLLVEASTKGVERVVYGESARRPPARAYQYGPRVTYNNPINPAYRQDGPTSALGRPSLVELNKARNKRDGVEIILASRQEAEMVLERLTDIINQYEMASVGDLNELVGLPSTHVDNKWGWLVLNDVVIRQIREGFLLDLPPAESL